MSDNACELFCDHHSFDPTHPQRRNVRVAGVRLLRQVFLLVAVCSALLASTFAADAQTAFIFPAQAVGAAAQVLPVAVAIQTAGTLGTIRVLTQGEPNLDFAESTPGTCVVSDTYLSGTCTVNVSFTPKFPGASKGAILLLDQGGQTMAIQILSGTGIG